jgi:hypothetical protein
MRGVRRLDRLRDLGPVFDYEGAPVQIQLKREPLDPALGTWEVALYSTSQPSAAAAARKVRQA